MQDRLFSLRPSFEYLNLLLAGRSFGSTALRRWASRLLLAVIAFLAWGQLYGQSAVFMGALVDCNCSTPGLPAGVARDSQGNLWVSNSGTTGVTEVLAVNGVVPVEPAPSSSTVTIGSSIFSSNTAGLAFDAAGDLWVADLGVSVIYEIVAVNGVIPSNPAINPMISTGLDRPYGLAFDVSGNLWFSDRANGAIKEALAVSGTVPANPTVNVVSSSFQFPEGIWIDAHGNVFVADPEGNGIVEMPGVAPPAVATPPASPTLSTIGSGFNFPMGVAVDSQGDVWVADHESGYFDEIVAVGGIIPASPVIIPFTAGSGSPSVQEPIAITIDNQGNIFLPEWLASTEGFVAELTPTGYYGQAQAGAGTATSTLPIGNSNVELLFGFTASTTINAPAVYTEGVTGKDFNIDSSGPGTCSSGGTTHQWLAGTSCNLFVTFKPIYPGMRLGAVQLTSGSSVLSTALLSGVGFAPMINFGTISNSLYSPTARPQVAASTAFQNPENIAVDPNHNVYIADRNGCCIYEATAASNYQTVTTPITTVNYPTTLGFDGAGDLIWDDRGSGRILEAVATNGVLGSNPTIVTLLGSITAPDATVIDNMGDVFFADEGYRGVRELVAINGRIPANPTIRNIESTILTGTLALDQYGNLFLTSSNPGCLFEISPVGGQIPTNATPQQVVCGLGIPEGLAVDAAGNIWEADFYNGLVEIQAINGAVTSASTLHVWSSGSAFGLGLDENGSVFTSLYPNVFEFDFSDPPAFTWSGSTNVGQTSGTTYTAFATDAGNQPITILIPSTGMNPSINSNWTWATTSANACPSIPNTAAITAYGTIGLNEICDLSISFSPLTAGPLTGQLTFTDNNFNNVPNTNARVQTGDATQSITLNGTAVGSAPITQTINFTQPTTPVVYSSGLTISLVATGGASGNPVVFTIDSSSTGSGSITGSTLTVTAAGTFVIDANQAGNSSYSAAAQVQRTVVVSVAAPAVSLAPSPVAFGNQTINTTSASLMVVVLMNTGTAPLTGISLSVTGTNASAFGLNSSTCGTTLAAGASCTISLNFTPTVTGANSASLSVSDNASNSPQSVPLSGTGLAANVVAPSPLVFNPAPVGISLASAQTLTATFQVNGYAAGFTPTATLHYGHSYSIGAVTCTGPTGSQSCSVPVTFQPQYPGGRRDAIFLMSGTTRLATLLIYGIGQGPFALVQPGVVTNPPLSASYYYYTSIVDENGTVYVLGDNSNMVFTVTKAGVVGTLPITGLNSPRGIGIDGAGILYIADQTYNGPTKTYDTVQGVQGSVPFPAPSTYIQTLAVGNTGNIYETNDTNVYTVPVSGTGTAATTAINPAITQGSTMIVDSGENVFIGGYTINEITAGGVQTEINTVGAGDGIGIDAADTVYATRYTLGGVAELPASGYGSALAYLDSSASPLGMSVGPDGTVYVGNYTNLDKVDRSQGLIAFGEQSQALGTASPQQIVTIYNGGNETLTISNIAISGAPFSIQTATTGTNCSNGSTIAPGALCEIAAVVTPVHAGVFNGSITVTSNSLNTTSTTQTIALTAFAYGVYVTPAPTSFTFPNQIVNTTSAPQTITLTNNGDLYIASFGTPVSGNSVYSIGLGTCTTGIAVGASCNLSITFTPTAAQTYNNITVTLPYSSSGGGTAPPPITFTLNGTGIPVSAPQVMLSPNPLAFPGTLVGTAATALPMTLSNPGNAALTITGISVTGTNASSFGQSNNCGSSLAAGASCTITVTFTPAATGSLSAAISVADNATGSPQSAAISGTGTAPQVAFTSNTLAFPSTIVGASAGTLSATMSNPGTAALTITGISVTGANAGSFGESNTCGASLAAGASCTITVSFTPAATGSLSAAISVADNAAGSPQTVALTGTGTQPQAVLAPNPLAFPSTLVGTAATALPMTLSNPGSAALTITGISVTGTNASSFAQSNNCGGSLAAGATCTITVTFTPAASGNLAAAISVADNAAGSPQSATLTGTGTVPLIPQAVLSPNPLAFPSTTINTPATPLPMTLSNPGNTVLAITGISVTGTNASSFGETNNCGTSLAAGASCTITVSFTPATAASLTAAISVTDNAVGSPQAATITGTGSAATYVVNSSTPTESIQPGAVAQYNLNIAPLGGTFNNLVTLSATGLPAGATVSFLPPAVIPGSAGAPSVMSIQTSTGLARLTTPQWPRPNPAPLLAILAGVPLLGFAARRRLRGSAQRWMLLALAAVALLPALAISGCGGGYFGPAPQTYTVTVVGTSGTLQESTTVSLTVQ